MAHGLGIGAMYVRSLTVYLVCQGTLDDYVYLEHGAHYAIGASFWSSVRRNTRLAAAGGESEGEETEAVSTA